MTRPARRLRRCRGFGRAWRARNCWRRPPCCKMTGQRRKKSTPPSDPDSDNAKAYFARQAFAQKNWPRTRSLTEELLRRHPEQPQFQDSLEAIAKAEAGK